MEELLNKLIEKGWKPRGHELHGLQILTDDVVLYLSDRVSMYKKFRELVSKESGLWQFVCEMSAYNNYNKEKGKVLTWKKFEDDKYQINGYSNGGGYIQDYEYRLIEASLKNEDELEQFLLQNIKVEG